MAVRQSFMRGDVGVVSLCPRDGGGIHSCRDVNIGRCRFGVDRSAVSRILAAGSGDGRGRLDALRSQSDLLGEPTQSEEEDFWKRWQEAWRVLLGISPSHTERERVKQRFNMLLVRDRGFNSTNLARLYNAAKGAIKEHVELEQDEDAEVMAVVERLGELRLDFRVKRVKSVLLDEPYSDQDYSNLEERFAMSNDQARENHDCAEVALQSQFERSSRSNVPTDLEQATHTPPDAVFRVMNERLADLREQQ